MKTTEKENMINPLIVEEVNNPKPETVKKSIFIEIFLAVKSGIFAFAVVFSFSILSKSLAYSLGSAKFFSININDVLFSFWAFLIFSFIAFLHNYVTPHK